MVARHVSRFPKAKFNENWIAVVPGKANSRLSEQRKTNVKFYLAFSREERSERPSQFLSGTKMLDRKITTKSRANFDRRMPIILTRRNTESETGRVAVAPPRVKRSAASPRARLREKHCLPCMQTSSSSPT